MTTEGMTQPAVEELQPPNHIPKSHATDNAPGQGYHPPHDARSKDVRESQTGAAESQAQADGPSPLTRRGSSMESRKSIYRGVQWDKNGQRWRARLYTDKTRHIGKLRVLVACMISLLLTVKVADGWCARSTHKVFSMYCNLS